MLSQAALLDDDQQSNEPMEVASQGVERVHTDGFDCLTCYLHGSKHCKHGHDKSNDSIWCIIPAVGE